LKAFTSYVRSKLEI